MDFAVHRGPVEAMDRWWYIWWYPGNDLVVFCYSRSLEGFMSLTDAEIRKAKPGAKAYCLTDTKGLFLSRTARRTRP